MKRRLLCFCCIMLVLAMCCQTAAYGGNDLNQDSVFRTVSRSGEYKDIAKWGKNVAVVTKDGHGIKYTLMGNVWTDISFDFFEESDIAVEQGMVFDINDIEVLGDQLIAGCSGGLVMIITDCQKCYKLKKISDFDIKRLRFGGTYMTAYGDDPQNVAQIPIDLIRQSKIDPSEVGNKLAGGGILIDVRDKADYNAAHIDGSVNIPIDSIYEIGKYPKDSVLIFCCYSGNRAKTAVERAREMGFMNVYNAGGYEELMAQL